jgi:predicted RNase H-like HicB family nuclease
MDNPHYIALIHKDPDSSYGVSFPDVPGVITAGDTLQEALEMGAEVLRFAFEDWPGGPPIPRTLDDLHNDPEFSEDFATAVLVAAIAPRVDALAAAQ